MISPLTTVTCLRQKLWSFAKFFVAFGPGQSPKIRMYHCVKSLIIGSLYISESYFWQRHPFTKPKKRMALQVGGQWVSPKAEFVMMRWSNDTDKRKNMAFCRNIVRTSRWWWWWWWWWWWRWWWWWWWWWYCSCICIMNHSCFSFMIREPSESVYV